MNLGGQRGHLPSGSLSLSGDLARPAAWVPTALLAPVGSEVEQSARQVRVSGQRPRPQAGCRPVLPPPRHAPHPRPPPPPLPCCKAPLTTVAPSTRCHQFPLLETNPKLSLQVSLFGFLTGPLCTHQQRQNVFRSRRRQGAGWDRRGSRQVPGAEDHPSWGGAASRPCAHPTGAHQPHPAAPCGGGPPLLTARPGPTAARSLLCRLSGPPASAAPGLCPYSSPSVFQAFPAAWGAAPPAPELGPGLWRAAQLLLRLRQGQL